MPHEIAQSSLNTFPMRGYSSVNHSRIDPTLLHAVRAATNLFEVVAKYVILDRSGRVWKGRCPFHPEKTPSFVVYPYRFYCFGCGAQGDAFEFLRKSERLPFRTAVARLAATAGVEMSGSSGKIARCNKKSGDLTPPHAVRFERPESWCPIFPPPLDARPPTGQQLRCSHLRIYYGGAGEVLCYIKRVEIAGCKKAFFPLSYGHLDGQLGV